MEGESKPVTRTIKLARPFLHEPGAESTIHAPSPVIVMTELNSGRSLARSLAATQFLQHPLVDQFSLGNAFGLREPANFSGITRLQVQAD